MNATAWDNINALLDYGYEINYDWYPAPENKTSNRGDTDQPNI